ncbi:unnamed protein product [Rotaria sp. Silwood1]|nr:unnamed protein product [Rotaria sp. Silwood1]CAF1075840.1 unnamed protein product [Rotaria sp. Silwood1]CAF1082725.1 unnamed protein product [Rotaria sp. Silwood1]CAF3411323.1 unnamed protein product [Rotaria sp. Silwood1]CAF3440661.1 unnamed protein product [Rotaria sp. Silwood1]
MSSTVQSNTFLPGGIGSLYNNNLALAPPYIFVIILGSLIFILIVIIIIREILTSRGILKDCCNFQGAGVQCLGCQECCASCAETCDCCHTTSIESCFDACCPKRGSLEFADIITCEACCGGKGCNCCGFDCVCAPTDVNIIMTSFMEDYFRTALSKELAIAPPERDHEHLSSTSRLLEKQREVTEAEALLANQKEEFKLKMQSLKLRREKLNTKEHELRESLANFEKYINELDSKRMRALKRAQDERELASVKDKDIEKLQAEIDDLKQKREELLARIAKYANHNKYLEKTVETADEFQEIRELIDRYTTLKTNKESLLEIQNQREEQLEGLRRKREAFIQKKNNEILILNNRIGDLQRELERVEIEARSAENEWNFIQTTAAEKTLLLGNVILAVRNLQQLVRHQQKVDKEEEGGETEDPIQRVRQQMDKVHMFIHDFTAITNEMKRSEQAKAKIS